MSILNSYPSKIDTDSLRPMLKTALILFCLGMGSVSYCHDSMPNAYEELDAESLAILHLGYGNGYLLSHQPTRALDSFQTALSLLENDSNHISPIYFFIAFGQSAAYDYLGQHEKSKQSLEIIFLALNCNDEKDKDIQFETHPSHDEAQLFVGLLKKIAELAPSHDIRAFLTSIVDSLAEELLPSFKLADQQAFERTSWVIDYGQESSLDLSKSVWKKFEKASKRIFKAFLKIKEIWEWAKDVDATLKKRNNS